jgi:ElaA protein
MNWQLKKMDELTSFELYEILKLRSQVFVVEQNCVYLDMDGIDEKSVHLYSINNENIIEAYCRIIPPNIVYKECSIGRVITNPKVRKKGLGKLLMQKAVDQCIIFFGDGKIKIGAQLYLKKFYEGFGFIQCSNVYDEDGIDHIKMIR